MRFKVYFIEGKQPTGKIAWLGGAISDGSSASIAE